MSIDGVSPLLYTPFIDQQREKANVNNQQIQDIMHLAYIIVKAYL